MNQATFQAHSLSVRIKKLTLLTLIGTCSLIGWVGASDSFAFPARFGLAPDNDQAQALWIINSAQRELLINVYQFESPILAQALAKKVASGVTLRLLLEGQPIPARKVSENGKKVIALLQSAIRQSGKTDSRLFLMTASAKNSAPVVATQLRRYTFDHAKYIVADRRYALIASENFGPTGFPVPGLVGNRGWTTLMDQPQIASQLVAIFATDTDPKAGDIIDVTQTPPPLTGQNDPAPPQKTRTIPAIAEGTGEVTQATLLNSPNSVGGLVSLIRSARKTLAMEQMSLPSVWTSPAPSRSPLVAEIVEAARRGVQVRVLLNDDRVFGGAPGVDPNAPPRATANEITVNLIRQIAQCEHLPMEARIVDIKTTQITYIHNKGSVIDGIRTLVSSINGTQNAVMANREVGVVLESPAAASYYFNAFDFDWKSSPSVQFPGAATGCAHTVATVMSTPWSGMGLQ